MVMLTANALEEHARASLEAGADLHCSKPVSPKALYACIEAVTSQGEAQDQAVRVA